MPETSSVIDVYTDVLAGRRQQRRGQRPTVHPLGEHDFRTPILPPR